MFAQVFSGYAYTVPTAPGCGHPNSSNGIVSQICTAKVWLLFRLTSMSLHFGERADISSVRYAAAAGGIARITSSKFVPRTSGGSAVDVHGVHHDSRSMS